MSFKRRLSSTEIYEYYPTLDHYTMGSKQSTQATGQSFQNTTKRKRSNTQASHHTQQIPIQNEYKPNAAPRMPSSVPQFDSQQCEALFQHYADPDMSNMIAPEGTQRFFEDLGLSIEDALIFPIAWKMHISTMGYISKDEWMTSMKEQKVDSIEKLKAKRSEFEKVFLDVEQFKEMYKYTFSYAKNRDQKCMDVDTAVVLWTMLLGDKLPIVHEFVTFLQQQKPVKVINRDQWQSFLDFASQDLDCYDESSAWPVLFDEFVDWKRS